MSSSYPKHHEVRRKSFKAWLSHKIKRKSKAADMHPIDSSPEKEVRRIGSYTKRVSHITEKYEKISKEKKRKEALEAANRRKEQPSSDSPYCLHIPSGVEEFQSLPLYSQMKFKLGVVLSNIHTPTPHLTAHRSIAVKNDLQLLLEESLYRNQWIADSSESGVVKETLSRINELDEDW